MNALPFRFFTCFRVIIFGILNYSPQLYCANIEVNVSFGSLFPQAITINTGDTVVWRMSGNDSHRVESFTGDFESPWQNELSSGYPFTFNIPDVYPYRTTSKALPPTSRGLPGLIIVKPLTNGVRPKITINTPLDGSHYYCGYRGCEAVPVIASVEEPSTIERVELYDGPLLVSQSTTPPFRFTLEGLSKGSHTLSAKAVAKWGESDTSRPVSIIVEDPVVPRFLPPKILRGNVLMVECAFVPGEFWVIDRFVDLQSSILRFAAINSGRRIFLEPIGTNSTSVIFRLRVAS